MKIAIGTREVVENELVSRHVSGRSIRSLAEDFGLSRNTVRQILRKREQNRQAGEESPLKAGQRLARAKKTDAFKSDICSLLERYPKLSAARIYEEIRARGYEGGSSQVRKLVHELRPRAKHEATVRFEVEPGQQGQMDWSFYKVRFLKGGVQEVCCFGYVLKYSRRLFIDFCQRRNYPNMVRRHQDAFAYFGGVPKECLYDGEKTVLLRWEAGRPVYNPKFVSFLTHYGCRPLGCRPGRPQTKGAIEASFRYVENNLLAGRTFHDLEDLRSCTRAWLLERADARPSGHLGLSVGECFAQVEAPELLALPAMAYDSSEVVMRMGALDGYVQFETNRYSIPYAYIGELLHVKADEEQVRVYDPQVRLIAQHLRHPSAAAATQTDPLHHLDQSQRWGIEPIRDKFQALGESASRYLNGLQQHHPRKAGYHARTILQMKERYFAHDIHAALAHAMQYQAYDSQAILYILKAKAKPRTLESYRNEKALRQLSEYDEPLVKQRQLEAYDELFGELAKGGRS